MEDNLREDVFVESCSMCGSNNYVFLFSDDVFGWECYCCLNTFWISDDHKLKYSLSNNIDLYECDFMLKNNLVPVAHGQFNG